jgi:hypothetical protein
LPNGSIRDPLLSPEAKKRRATYCQSFTNR